MMDVWLSDYMFDSPGMSLHGACMHVNGVEIVGIPCVKGHPLCERASPL